MRIAKFCERNTEAKEAVNVLQKEFPTEIGVAVVDCFRRCLQCRVKPFCRIQLETIEANDPAALVIKVLKYVRKN